MGRVLAACLGSLFCALLAAGCGGAPQIVDYAPERGATGVPTSAPIRVDFDRPVDRQSVAARFSIEPAAQGRITWPSSRELLYVQQAPLRTDTSYQVVLRAGYRSLGGGAADLDHSWRFRTEGPLQVTGSSPAPAETGVDPAAYLQVLFNHRMSAASLNGGFRLSPDVNLQATLAAGDPFRVVLAPAGLLAASSTYTLTVTEQVTDSDGNPLPKTSVIVFQTGTVRPLHGWLTCVAAPPAAAPTQGGDLWMIDQNRLPRELLRGPVLAYAWAPSADELTLETAERNWVERRLDGTTVPLPVAADSILPLGGGRGFVYLDHGDLGLLSRDGATATLVGGVSALAVSADGRQVAYTVPGAGGTELWVLSVELRSRFQLGSEPGAVSNLAWAPDSSRLAYELVSSTGSAVRVRVLAAPGAATVAAGEVSAPAWDADSAHLYVLASRGAPAVNRIYRIATSAGLQTLTAGGALTTPPNLAVGPPVPSPDGHQVAFVGSEARGDQVWLMNSDGTGLIRLTGGPDYSYSCRAPAWTPPA